MPHSLSPSALRLSNKNLPEICSRNTEVEACSYSRDDLKHGIVHVGVGGFHRAHLAVYVDKLLSQFDLKDWSICGVGITKWDAPMRDALKPQDYLYTVIERSEEGSVPKVQGVLTDFLLAEDDNEAVIAKMADPATHIVSMTITESGYYYNENTHELEAHKPEIQADLKGDGPPRTIFGFLFAAQARRHAAGLKPFTVMSCDNMQGNGTITRNMLLSFAKLKDPAIHAWLEKEGAFPNSMVDRITPRTVQEHKTFLADTFGIQDEWPVVTEPFMQWVLEDQFSDGRPPFEKVGVQVVKTLHEVEQFEMHKLRLLNASHSALAYLAYLSGFEYVHEVIADNVFRSYIINMMQKEVRPLLPEIEGVDIEKYCNTLLARFGNPILKDEVTRLCLGGSGKFPQFIMPSIAEQIRRLPDNPEDGAPLRRLTLAVAGWFRFSNGLDEAGKPIKVDDPMAAELQEKAREGGHGPHVLLGIKMLFGDDLRDDERFVKELTDAMESLYTVGARKTLENYV
ncbi:Polyol:NADP oxidoreductase [Apiospora rasikravindrae]|uniref:Mannitol 2-dehydrogenase n=1 Tax=Apiospora rasikravindrae TaxID=990691 RepID=A0ABR1SW52_9PEZI